MDEKVFERDNNLISHSCGKLYLDSKTSDVSFIFAADTDHPERIVAHKNLLSAGSPVFDTMFYGSLIESGDVPIVDATPGAFREFLQFFYMSQVRLTSRNVGEVINLCKKYELSDAVKVCEIPFQKSLTVNDFCWGHEVAILLELENLQKFCEKKIKENAQEILTSESFLECNRKSLDKILRMVQSNCSAMMVVEACMQWAKNENIRNDLDISPVNLRAQLDDLFDRIPFNNMSMEQFFNYTSKYQGFFSDNEIKMIVQMIATKKFQSSCFANSLSFTNFECNRHGPGDLTLFDFKYVYCTFESNKRILLKEFYLPQLQINSNLEGVNCLDVIYTFNGPFTCLQTDLLAFGKETLTSEMETLVVLPEPAFIEANQIYYIGILTSDYGHWKDTVSFIQQSPLELTVNLTDGTQLTFYPSNTLVSRLIFQKPENHIL